MKVPPTLYRLLLLALFFGIWIGLAEFLGNYWHLIWTWFPAVLAKEYLEID